MSHAPARTRPLWVLAAIMGVAALVAIGWLWGRPALPGGDLAADEPDALRRLVEVVLVALGFYLAERAAVVVRIRRDGINASLAELPMAVALLLASPGAFVLGRALGSVPALWPTTAGGPRARLKFAYNVTMLTLAAALTWAVHDALLTAFGQSPDQPGADPAGALGALALTLAILVGYAWVHAMIVLAIRLADPGTEWPQVLRAIGFGAAVTVALSAAGAFMAVAAHRDGAFLVLDVVAAVGLWLLLRVYGSLGSEHLRLQRLYDFSRELAVAPDLDAGTAATLRSGAALLDARAGALYVPWADREHCWVLRRGGALERVPIDQDAADAVTALLDGGASAVVDVVAEERPGAAVLGQVGSRRVLLAEFSGLRGHGWLAYESPTTAREARRALVLVEAVAGQSAAALGRTELVDELRIENQRREREALHDRLTTLPNRDYFVGRLRELVALRRDDEEVAVLIVDLDRFKEVNDSLGHHHGDLLLHEVGRRLGQSLRSSEFLARLGGDEFGILLLDKDAGAAATGLADRIARLLEHPLEIADTTIAVSGSIGVSLCPRHAEEPTTLMRQADIAMYAAKRDDVDYVLYEAQDEQAWLRRVEVLGRMRAADFDEVIEVHFQPQVDLDTRQPVAMEALARWHDPVLGHVSPVEFIPVAEQSGLIRPLTMVVVEKALPLLRACLEDGHDLSLAVNLSARALLDLEVVDFIGEVLREEDLDPARLTIEVTESVFVSDSQRLHEVLRAYEHLGVQLSIDDFGTGYSSLGYLRRLPARELKIDRSFVDGMVDDASKLAIVRSTVALAHDLDMRAVAEGIEDLETMALLRRLGCDVGQGYFLGRPMPADQLQAWLVQPTIPPADALDEVQGLTTAIRIADTAPPLFGRS